MAGPTTYFNPMTLLGMGDVAQANQQTNPLADYLLQAMQQQAPAPMSAPQVPGSSPNLLTGLAAALGGPQMAMALTEQVQQNAMEQRRLIQQTKAYNLEQSKAHEDRIASLRETYAKVQAQKQEIIAGLRGRREDRAFTVSRDEAAAKAQAARDKQEHSYRLQEISAREKSDRNAENDLTKFVEGFDKETLNPYYLATRNKINAILTGKMIPDQNGFGMPAIDPSTGEKMDYRQLSPADRIAMATKEVDDLQSLYGDQLPTYLGEKDPRFMAVVANAHGKLSGLRALIQKVADASEQDIAARQAALAAPAPAQEKQSGGLKLPQSVDNVLSGVGRGLAANSPIGLFKALKGAFSPESAMVDTLGAVNSMEFQQQGVAPIPTVRQPTKLGMAASQVDTTRRR